MRNNMEKKTETQALMEALEREVLRSNKPKIDWEKRRYEIAKDAMNGLLSSRVEVNLNCKVTPSAKLAVKFAVTLADELIKELKGGEK